jgi:transposase
LRDCTAPPSAHPGCFNVAPLWPHTLRRARCRTTSLDAFGPPGKLSDEHKAYLTCLIEEGPIPAIHGVVRWRACDLIMQLHEKFGLSVSDDTIYRALKDLGFSHVSARPKAYKQIPDAMDAFKKTLPYAWRRSAKSSRRAHR